MRVGQLPHATSHGTQHSMGGAAQAQSRACMGLIDNTGQRARDIPGGNTTQH